MKYLFLLLLTFSYSIFSADYIYETELDFDKKFIESKKKTLEKKYEELRKYFQVKLAKPVLVQILPFQQNKEFKNCARIYGPYRIYAHSIKSLKKMKDEEKKDFNAFCITRSYDDLYYTLIHEFTHSLTHINTNTGKIPRWIWEGIAVSFSGQLEYTSMRKGLISRLKKYKKINICNSNISNKDVYFLGGAVISYLESLKPKLTLSLVKHLREDIVFEHAKTFFSNFNIKCELNIADIRTHYKLVK